MHLRLVRALVLGAAVLFASDVGARPKIHIRIHLPRPPLPPLPPIKIPPIIVHIRIHAARDALDRGMRRLEVIKKTTRAEVFKPLEASVAYTHHVVTDIHDHHVGTALHDLERAVASAMSVVDGGALTEEALEKTVLNAIDAQRALVEAVSDVREGKFGEATQAVGRGLQSAGQVVAIGDPEIGAALTEAGASLQTYGKEASEVLALVKQGQLDKAIVRSVPATAEVREALAIARLAKASVEQGHWHEATLRLGFVVAGVAAPVDTVALLDLKKSLDHAGQALDAVKDGKYGSTMIAMGDSLTTLGVAVATVDPDAALELGAIGATVRQAAARAKAVEAEEKALKEQARQGVVIDVPVP